MNLAEFDKTPVRVEFAGKELAFTFNPLKFTAEILKEEVTIPEALARLELSWEATETVDGQEQPAAIAAALACLPLQRAVWQAIQGDLFPNSR